MANFNNNDAEEDLISTLERLKKAQESMAAATSTDTAADGTLSHVKPSRYDYPTRSMPIENSTSNRARVASSSNLVGAALPDHKLVRSKRIQVRLEDLLRNPTITILLVLGGFGVIISVAALPFFLRGRLVSAVPNPERITQAAVTESASQDLGAAQQQSESQAVSKGKSDVVMSTEQGAAPRSSPEWAIELGPITDTEQYESLLAKLQRDGFDVKVKVFARENRASQFFLQIYQDHYDTAELQLDQVRRIPYLSEVSSQIVKLKSEQK